jgi:hypothetical protein
MFWYSKSMQSLGDAYLFLNPIEHTHWYGHTKHFLLWSWSRHKGPNHFDRVVVENACFVECFVLAIHVSSWPYMKAVYYGFKSIASNPLNQFPTNS